MKKFVLSVATAGALLTGFTVGTEEASAAWSSVEQSHYERGTFIGWIDSNSFEVKTTTGKYFVFRTSNAWYQQNLVEGRSYTYYYYTNSYGQKIIKEIQK